MLIVHSTIISKALAKKLKEVIPDLISSNKQLMLISTSQRQAIIKLIEKKIRDKRFIKNWRPVSLLNIDSKIISEALSEKLKEVLPDLISSQQKC